MLTEGLDATAARARLWLADERGILAGPARKVAPEQAPFVHADMPTGAAAAAGSAATDDGRLTAAGLVQLVHHIRPTVVIGVSGQGGLFSTGVLDAAATVSHRPIIMALSNPSDYAECTAATAYAATDARAIFASGGASEPVRLHLGPSIGGPSTYADMRSDRREPAQVNNVLAFPGIVAGVHRAGNVTGTVADVALVAAAQALAALVTDADRAVGRILPPVHDLPAISAYIALAVAAALDDRTVPLAQKLRVPATVPAHRHNEL